MRAYISTGDPSAERKSEQMRGRNRNQDHIQAGAQRKRRRDECKEHDLGRGRDSEDRVEASLGPEIEALGYD